MFIGHKIECLDTHVIHFQGGVNSLNKKYFETLLRYKSKTSI